MSEHSGLQNKLYAHKIVVPSTRCLICLAFHKIMFLNGCLNNEIGVNYLQAVISVFYLVVLIWLFDKFNPMKKNKPFQIPIFDHVLFPQVLLHIYSPFRLPRPCWANSVGRGNLPCIHCVCLSYNFLQQYEMVFQFSREK